MISKEITELIEKSSISGDYNFIETNHLKDGTEVYIYQVLDAPGKFHIYMLCSKHTIQECPNVFVEERYSPRRLFFDLKFNKELKGNWIGSILMKNLIEIAIKKDVEELEGDFDFSGDGEDKERRKNFYTKLLFKFDKSINEWVLISDDFKEALKRCIHVKED